MRSVARLVLIAFCFPTLAHAQRPTTDMVLRHATLLDGVDTMPHRDVAITIRNGRLLGIVPDRRFRAHAADSIIDLHGAWVVPGLIDAHVHIGLTDGATPDDNVRDAKWALAGGATTLRSAGAAAYADVAVRDQFRTGASSLPRILPAGYTLTPIVTDNWLRAFPKVRPLLTAAMPADSLLRLNPAASWRLTGNPAAIDTAVASLAAHGAAWVKVFATGRAGLVNSNPLTQLLTESDMREAVRAASKHGLLVEAHAHGDAGIRAAVRAGVRTIEHGTYASDTTLRLMRERGTCFVPTLSYWDELATMQDSVLRARAASMRASAEDAVRRARALGVAVIAGTDNIYKPGSRQLVDELRALARAGLSPSEVLVAATSRSARCLNLASQLGAVVAGRAADLLVLDGDPRADLGRLGAPRMVMVAGRIVIDRR